LRFRASGGSSSRLRFHALFLALNFALLRSRFRAPALFDFSRSFFALLDFSRSSIFRTHTYALLDFHASSFVLVSLHTARTGHPKQDRQNRTGRTEQAEQNRQNRTVRTGQSEQGSQNRTARTGQAEQDCLDRRTRTGQPGQDKLEHGGQYRKRRTGRTDKPGRRNRTGRVG
jgi:hypothetical protein